MPRFDLPLEELREYRPPANAPSDFDAFWRETLETSRLAATPPRFERIQTPLRTRDGGDVPFSGYGGQPIRAWLLAPAGAARPLPAIVEYTGYGGGRGLVTDRLLWASAGYAHFL